MTFGNMMISAFKNLFHLFFPKTCLACAFPLLDQEVYVCTACRHVLPVTNFHVDGSDAVLQKLYGRVHLELATSLLRFYKKGIVQKLIHNLKYNGQEEVGEFLGHWLGSELSELPEYKAIDAVLPVPLHKTKLRARGYNQVAKCAQIIAEYLDAEYVDDVLIKVHNTKSQTTKTRLARWSTQEQVFKALHLEKIKDKHVLVVDDLITTGATLEECCLELQKGVNVKISIATMATA